MVSRKRLYLLSLLSGILFFLGWPPYGVPLILFFAFVPLLYIEHAFATRETKAKQTLLFGLAYLTFFIWNVAAVWWIYNVSEDISSKLFASGGAILGNSLLMAMVFWIFHVVKRRMLSSNWRPQTPNLIFLIFWLSFEFIHHRWELAWPWLSLGNAFGDNPGWIQWYEYTGTPGGSLWVLALNLMIFEWLKGKPKRVYAIIPTILLPILISFAIHYSYEEKVNPVSVVVVQPNIDPYSEKFTGMDYDEQLTKMLDLAKQKVDSTTEYLVFPETALIEEIWDNRLEHTASYHRLKEFIKLFPRLKIVVGASTFHYYEKGEPISGTARKFEPQEGYYDAYNTALQIDSSDSVQSYHKSKLVPGVERIPYTAVFGFLENLAMDLGGTSGSLGTQEERTVFRDPTQNKYSKPSTIIAPIICFESVFGEFVSEFVKNGASLIFIITNDGWWGDTPGYRQHLSYGRLRAIETRRSIARSANTGTSCFIDQRGEILQATEWWTPAVIQASINSNSGKTFYINHGDIIGRVCFYVSAIIVLLLIGRRFLFRKN